LIELASLRDPQLVTHRACHVVERARAGWSIGSRLIARALAERWDQTLAGEAAVRLEDPSLADRSARRALFPDPMMLARAAADQRRPYSHRCATQHRAGFDPSNVGQAARR
jgi:hypothetical protein